MTWHDYWLGLALSGSIVVAAFLLAAVAIAVIGRPQ